MKFFKRRIEVILSFKNNFPDPIIDYCSESVYYPSDDTYLILDFLKNNINDDFFDGKNIKNVKKILDLGTGTGIIAIFLQMIKKKHLKFKPEIYASDILKESIEYAKLNEKSNNEKSEIKFIESDLFNNFPNSLKNSFDVVIFNPPYLPSSNLFSRVDSKEKVDYSWNGGKGGLETIVKFLDQVNSFLNLDFYVYFISSSRTDLKELNEQILIKGFKHSIMEKKHMFFEDILLNRLER